MKELLFALWFFLPAGLANAAPVFMSKVPGLRKLNAPMDFGRSYRGKRIFGDNKTWRGLISGTVIATLAVAIQHYLHRNYAGVRSAIDLVDYCDPLVLLLGPLLGLGALLGDAIESFFKRQSGVKPGHAWFPFDQIDYIIGGLLLSVLVVRLRLIDYAAIGVTWFLMHLIFSYLGYIVGLKSKPI